MNKQKLKEPRHVCRMCGAKLYESKMILFGAGKNGLPVWVCRDLDNLSDSCLAHAISAVDNGVLKVSVYTVNQHVTKVC